MRAVSGVVLGQRYRLTDPIASGGMGEVWKAHDDLLGRTVAVKVLREELVSEPGFLARFRTEARNTARLAHANIATTYDYGESDGSAWLVMELVPGEPLSDILAREGALDPRRAMGLLGRAAAGLAAAHAAGIVHRDVKPGNLLVTPDGNVKVTDFGIARAAAEAPLTATGQVMGTAAYLAPEQATGRRDLTPAVDVYALGVVAHEMLAGERPFTGESQVAIALAQVNDPPPPLPRWVPAAARELVALCLAKDAADRPGEAGVVADAAGRIAEGDDAGAMAVLESATAGYGYDAPGATVVDPTVVALPPTAAMRGETGPTGATEHLWPAAGTAGAAAAGTAGVPRTGGAQYGAHGNHHRSSPDSLGQDSYRDDTYRDDPYDADTYDADPRGHHAGPPTGPSRAGSAQAGSARAGSAPEAPRRRLTVPLLGLVAVLLVVVLVLLVRTFSSGSTAGQTPATGSTATPATPSPTSASTPATPSPVTPSQSTPSDTPTPTTPSSTASGTPSPSPSSASGSPTSTSPSSAVSSPAPTTGPSASGPTSAPATPSTPATSNPA